MKLFGAILIIVSCSYTGWFIGNSMSLRRSLMRNLHTAILQLNAIIRHERTALPDAFIKIGERSGGQVGELFKLAGHRLNRYDGEPIERVWSECVKRCLSKSQMSESDMERLAELGTGLGLLDAKLQEELLVAYTRELEGGIALLNEEIRRKTGFYRAMGVLAGLFITLILI